MVMKIANPGNITNHQASNSCLPRFNKDPQVTTSSGTPIPRNERELSISIAEATPKAIETNTGAKAFGKACFAIALKLLLIVL